MANEKKYHWHKIAESAAELSERGTKALAPVKVAGKDICVVFHQEKIYGCANKCPHAGGRLHEGYVDAAGNIVCPLHRYKFRLENGFNCSGEGYYLKTYPVQENDEGLFVGIEAHGWW